LKLKANGKTDEATDMNFQKLLPPFWLLFSIILMVGFNWWLPIKQLIHPPLTYWGIGAIVIGILMVLFCARLFRQKGTTIKPFEESSNLVDEGLFKYSRNPIYLGMIVFLFGLWFVLGSLTPLVVIPVFVWLIQEKFIKEEEKMLEEKFGEEYREYKARVRRWL
jgi:protein-S-isoprenylcysteine O-methyltransferase Ste14